jgi:large subunit ribosomal protein L21
MALAVIKTGGKQYFVSPGEKIKIEKLNAKEGKEVIFKEVLLLKENGKIEIGNPLIKGAKVIGKVISQGKNKKVIVFKYKSKTRYRIKKGYRQPFSEVEILRIEKE